MNASQDQVVDAITELVPRLMTAMDGYDQLQHAIEPDRFAELSFTSEPLVAEVAARAEAFGALAFPEELEPVRTIIGEGAKYELRAYDGLSRHDEGMGHLMKANRAHCRAQEIMYALAGAMSPINRYYLEPRARSNDSLLQALASDATQQAGVMVANNDRKARGGFSLYVPENLDPETPAPLVIAMHGGTGHGADFLWSWVREARTRGFIVLAPTAQQDTWSLMGEEHDYPHLLQMIDYVQSNWHVDPQHILATGMSDGGSYAVIAGLKEDSPITHIANFSGVLHMQVFMDGSIARAAGKPIYIVHGSLDQMFPIETAYMAKSELESAGAELTYRQIDGLTHSFARFEVPAMIEWFNPALRLPE